ncbi:xanthine dehydrogenase family protein molybdopterin-binding subunit [Allohahella marinimesophila]|uniref:Xanthine dehydrogenase family protein molybdopterin-binding subunit n=2 Tax=Allohahella marinimesophila TaxID=1054972 RepID=A0ABP7P502_9GAMM
MQGRGIRYHGYPVALVVAETLEQARHAANCIRVDIDETDVRVAVSVGDSSFDELWTHPELQTPESLDGGLEPDAANGDFESQWQHAVHQVDVCYHTPNQVSAAMEPHATIASYDGDKLTVYCSLQVIGSAVEGLANTLKLDPSKVEVNSPYIGGGFGSKLGIHNDAVLACLASLMLKQPVRVVQTRRNVFSNAPHRGSSVQHIRLGMDAAGRLVAIGHDSVMPAAHGYPFAEATGACARTTYSAAGIRSRHRVLPVNMPVLDSTRAPGDAIGTLAFESAIDEAALVCGIDPLDFRLNNMPDKHPTSGLPFSSHDLAGCLREGAERFGWAQRSKVGPEARKLRGFGLASAVRINMLVKSAAELELDRTGAIVIRTDMTDIGTGSYTILAQIAAAELGIAVEDVTVKLGRSAFPTSSGSGGSFGAGSTGSAVQAACHNLKRELIKLLSEAPLCSSMSKGAIDSAQLSKGRILVDNEDFSLQALLESADLDTLCVKGQVEPGEDHDNYAQSSWGAHFVEVSVDQDTAEVTVERITTVVSAGTILNSKTAASQVKGGVVWGLSYALRESLMLDERYGAFMNRDLAEYHIPVNRDVPDIDCHFRIQPDFRSNPLGSKGIGELGICGAGAAIANAVFDATGVRIRSFPITLDKILEKWEADAV